MHEVYSAGKSIFALEFNLDQFLDNTTQRAETFRWLDFSMKSIVFHHLGAPVVLVGTGGCRTGDSERKNANAHEMVGEHITKMAVYKESKLHLHFPPQRLSRLFAYVKVHVDEVSRYHC